jgi:predicted DNA binding CopG/RHH family protein
LCATSYFRDWVLATTTQGVEEYLERSNSRMLTALTPRKAGRVNTKLGFSAERPSRRDVDDDVLNQSTYTPIKADQSGLYRTQRSIFMENQLDLNESEMEYYEGVVNDLAEKLERMQEEKDDLQSISNALGERLQRLSQQKEDALVQASKEFEAKKAELELRLAQLEAALSNKTQVCATPLRAACYSKPICFIPTGAAVTGAECA